MSHLHFPFQESALMLINNEKQHSKLVEVEIARSRIEIYQGLQYRQEQDFQKPLVAIYNDEHEEYETLSRYNFDVEFIAVRLNFLVQQVKTISAYSGLNESYRQKFSCFSCVVMAPSGFIRNYGIQPDLSRIMIFSREEVILQPRFITDPFRMN
ncbi:hypothetical protein [Flavihumibacter profundi]|uniref:hypothetical protein n=1 Tax=Flavihumibacter profundi TaxID=2716883 RepID=UPI001CC46AF9|nr:hypothetical protein [Flavihumibacter profundi]MBZ5857608.1 hypothetical protein [Flavihumibacter profundi]